MTGAVVVFRPGLGEGAVLDAVQAVGGRLVWAEPAAGVWALDFDEPAAARNLYGRGA